MFCQQHPHTFPDNRCQRCGNIVKQEHQFCHAFPWLLGNVTAKVVSPFVPKQKQNCNKCKSLQHKFNYVNPWSLTWQPNTLLDAAFLMRQSSGRSVLILAPLLWLCGILSGIGTTTWRIHHRVSQAKLGRYFSSQRDLDIPKTTKAR